MDPSSHRGTPSHPHHSRTHDSSSNNNNNNNETIQQRVRFAAGEPQVSYRIYQPSKSTASRDRQTATTSKPRPPSVFWDDRDNASQLTADNPPAGYTFYREPTPTPPDDDGPEKRIGHGSGFAPTVGENSTIRGGTASSNREFNGDGNWNAGGAGKRPLAAKKKLLWVLIAAGVLVLIGVAVGVGVGLGVGLKSKDSKVEANSSILPASLLNPSPTPTNPSTPTTTTQDPLATTTTPSTNPRPTYNSDCPALNNTIYHVPGSTRTFKRLCGIDYSGDGATDLTHTYTESMADCMHSCASFNECTACAWGYMEGDTGSQHRCYMKKGLVKAHEAAGDWCFATLQ